MRRAPGRALPVPAEGLDERIAADEARLGVLRSDPVMRDAVRLAGARDRAVECRGLVQEAARREGAARAQLTREEDAANRRRGQADSSRSRLQDSTADAARLALATGTFGCPRESAAGHRSPRRRHGSCRRGRCRSAAGWPRCRVASARGDRRRAQATARGGVGRADPQPCAGRADGACRCLRGRLRGRPRRRGEIARRVPPSCSPRGGTTAMPRRHCVFQISMPSSSSSSSGMPA